MGKIKIAIFGSEDTLNVGSFMLCLNFVYYLSIELMNNVIFYVIVNTDGDFIRLKQELPENIEIKRISWDYPKEKSFIKRIKNLLFFDHNIINNLGINGIVILGGDIIGELYNPPREVFFQLVRFYITSRKVSLFFAGHSMGPFYSWRKWVVKFFLKNCHIYTRESLGADYLREIGVNNFIESNDLAFLDLYSQNSDNSIIEKYNLKENEYVVMVPSGLVKKYTNNRGDYIKGWVDMVEVTAKRFEDKKIILLPHVLIPHLENDVSIIREIIEKIGEKYNILPIYDKLSVCETRKILGSGFLTISGRMHAAISTYQMLKPAICISYTYKFNGVIGKELGNNYLVIDSNDNLWKNDSISNELEKRFNFLLPDYDSVVGGLRDKIKMAKIKSYLQIKSIAKIVREEQKMINK